MKADRQPACFVGTGAAGLAAGETDPTHAWLARLGESFRASPPCAVICVSTEWSAPRFTVTTSDRPGIAAAAAASDHAASRHAPPGSRRIARKVMENLLYAKLDVVGDDAHPLDAGAWMPAAAMFPAAAVPVVQISLHASLDPEAHFAMGRAIERLRDEGVVIFGSGGAIRYANATGAPEASRRFQSWVVDLVTRSAPYARARGLCRFRDHADVTAAPEGGRGFLPLLVVAGAASADKSRDNLGELAHSAVHEGVSTSSFVFRR